MPEKLTTTSIARLSKVDWVQVEKDVVRRIRLIREAVEVCRSQPSGDAIADELILPSIRHLAAFCGCVSIRQAFDTEDAVSDG